MTPSTAAMATIVVSADMPMSQRVRAIMAAAASAFVPCGAGAGGAAEGLPDLSSMSSKNLSQQTQKSVIVAGDETGARLDRVLAAHVVDLSRSRLKALIEAGAFAVDGRTIRD